MRCAPRLAFAVFTLLALAYTPWKSAGSLREAVSCEGAVPLDTWWLGLSNSRHILSFGLLCLLAIACFSAHRLTKAAGAVLGISILVEIEQAFLAHGHCRIRDLLPNAVAVCIAALIWLGATHIFHRLSRTP